MKNITTNISRGFTLLELVVGFTIVGIVASIGTVAYNGYIETSKNAAARTQIAALAIVINDYALDYGAFPDSLEEIGNGDLLDPWGNPYQYLNFSAQDNRPSSPGRSDDDNNNSSESGEYGGDHHGERDEEHGRGRDDEHENEHDRGRDNEHERERDRGGSYMGQVRKDRNLVPINSNFDLYSMGQDGQSRPPLTARVSRDDIIYANDGAFIGLAEDY